MLKIEKRNFGKTLAVIFITLVNMLISGVPGRAVDFRGSGEWIMGFGAGDGYLYSSYRRNNPSPKERAQTRDIFEANLRVRLQLDAYVFETLSGSVAVELGDQRWGLAKQGGALGADGANILKMKYAYLDWMIPNVKFRMGLQSMAFPTAATGSAILDADVAGIVANYKFSDSVALTALWGRTVNDNFTVSYGAKENQRGYLDNMDIFALTLPLTAEEWTVIPWLAYGILGKNALRGLGAVNGAEPWVTNDGRLGQTIPGLTPGFNFLGGTPLTCEANGAPFTPIIWVGLPLTLSLWDPWNFELDLNYGYVGEFGEFDVVKRGDPADIARGIAQRQGWLVKALIEYKTDFLTPGIFGWYSSGDDGDVKNGSERIPTIAGAGKFTSFIGNGNLAFGTFDDSCDWAKTYSGTWGAGLRLKNISFTENLTHTFRLAWWGGYKQSLDGEIYEARLFLERGIWPGRSLSYDQRRSVGVQSR